MKSVPGFRFDTRADGDTVHKVSHKGSRGTTLLSNSQKAHDIHKEYLTGYLPAETEVKLYGPDGRIIVHQELIQGCQHVDILQEKDNPEFRKLLTKGARMQKEQGILFDILGMQGMIEAWNKRFRSHPIKQLSDFFTPVNAGLLKILFGTSSETLNILKDSFPGGIIAYNILKSPEGKFYFCDNTDLRPLKKFPIQPEHMLNKMGNWITNLVLEENNLPRADS